MIVAAPAKGQRWAVIEPKRWGIAQAGAGGGARVLMLVLELVVVKVAAMRGWHSPSGLLFFLFLFLFLAVEPPVIVDDLLEATFLQ